MEAASRLVNTILPLMYALTVAAYAADFFRDDAFGRAAARRLMELTLVLHAVHIAVRTALYDHVPLASLAELLTTVAFAVSLVYIVVERRTGSPRSTTNPRPSYISATACSSRARMTVSGKCSRWMPSSGRPEALAVASARSTSAISASVRVTIQEVSRARVSPRQALASVIGVMRTWLTGRLLG